jgi:hypothetical protein
MEARNLPEIPFTYMVAALLGLGIVFLFGLSIPSGRREPENIVDRIETIRREIFRKAV